MDSVKRTRAANQLFVDGGRVRMCVIRTWAGSVHLNGCSAAQCQPGVL
jgi:hypothetical protein